MKDWTTLLILLNEIIHSLNE